MTVTSIAICEFFLTHSHNSVGQKRRPGRSDSYQLECKLSEYSRGQVIPPQERCSKNLAISSSYVSSHSKSHVVVHS